MLKVFLRRLPNIPLTPLLYPNLGAEERPADLFQQKAFVHLSKPLAQIVEDPLEADALLIPHNYPAVRSLQDYLEAYVGLSLQLSKKIIVIWHGDSADPVRMPNTVVFRTSQYRSQKRSEEIMMPPYTEDLLNGELPTRSKPAKPVVGFCGWAEYRDLQNRIGTMLQNMHIACTGQPAARKKGLVFRKKALSVLAKSSIVEPNVIIRSSYSGHRQTIRQDPIEARQEYLQNMLESDAVLCVKGDGNYSLRFFEALSLGRIPVFVDTDCVLPLSDIIPYDDFMIRVDHTEIPRLDQIVAERFASLSESDFAEMQKKARDAFEKHLRIDRFFAYALKNLL